MEDIKITKSPKDAAPHEPTVAANNQRAFDIIRHEIGAVAQKYCVEGLLFGERPGDPPDPLEQAHRFRDRSAGLFRDLETWIKCERPGDSMPPYPEMGQLSHIRTLLGDLIREQGNLFADRRRPQMDNE